MAIRSHWPVAAVGQPRSQSGGERFVTVVVVVIIIMCVCTHMHINTRELALITWTRSNRRKGSSLGLVTLERLQALQAALLRVYWNLLNLDNACSLLKIVHAGWAR